MGLLVSVVMPIYNAGVYLKDAINDVLVQTYGDLELICVNDGSTDDSLEIVRFFAGRDDRIKVIDQVNVGAAEARNVGIATARGKYIMFLDSDDRYEPQMIERAVSKAEKNNADITIFDGCAFDKETSIVYEMKLLYRENIPDKEVFSYIDVPDRILQLSIESPWNKLYNSRFVKDNNLKFMTSRYCNDVYFVMSAMELADRICVMDDRLIYYRTGNRSSVSRRRAEDPGCLFAVLLNTLHKLQESDRFETIWKSFANYSWERIYAHINEVLDENNFEVFIGFLSGKLFEELRITRLAESDLNWDEFYKCISCFKEKGGLPMLFRVFRRNARYLLDKEYGINSNEIIKNTDAFLMFDIGRIPNGSNVVIYGAGNRGKKIVEAIQHTDKYNIVLWVDRKPNSNPINGIRVREPFAIEEIEYDYILIAIDSFGTVREIIGELSDHISLERIVW